jgi:transcriptional regulator with XRE-family HTH domain
MATAMNTGELIEHRRVAAGLTFSQLAHQLGLNADVVRRLSEGEQLDRLPLSTIRRLCRLLDVEIDQLLAGRRPARPPEPAPDDVKVEAAIARHGGVATREDLALALKWPLERLEAALRTLERRLQPTGIRLRQLGWNSYALTSNLQALSEEEARCLHRTCGGRMPLTTEAASVLLAIINHVGHDIWIIDELLGPHRDGANSLAQQGLVVQRHGSTEPDEDVIFSLRLRSWGYDIAADPKGRGTRRPRDAMFAANTRSITRNSGEG